LRTVHGVASRHRLRLVLVVQGTTTGRERRDITGDSPHETADVGYLRQLADVRRAPAPRVGELPALPNDDFPLFLERCRQALDETAYRETRNEFEQALDVIEKRLATGELGLTRETVARELQALVTSTTDRGRVLTRLRAFQRSLLLLEWHVTANVPMFWAALDRDRCGALDAATCQRLRRFSTTQAPALAACALATRLTADELSELTVDDITDRGEHVRVGGVPFAVPEAARGLLRAHRRYVASIETTALWGRTTLERPGLLQRRLDAVAARAGLGFSASAAKTTACDWAARHGIAFDRLPGSNG
jgi:hypothetical protein